MVSSQSFSCIGRWRGGFPGAGVSPRAARIKPPRAPRPQLHCERAEAPHRTPQYDWAIFAFAGAVGAHVLALLVTLGPSVVLVRHVLLLRKVAAAAHHCQSARRIDALTRCVHRSWATRKIAITVFDAVPNRIASVTRLSTVHGESRRCVTAQ